MQRRIASRRRSGMTVVEMVIASTILLVVFSIAFPTMSSVSNAGTDGRVRSTAQGDNRQALTRIMRDLLNASATAVDDTGQVRMEILDGEARHSLSGNLGYTSEIVLRSESSGGGGVLATSTGVGGVGMAANYYGGDPDGGLGSAARGGTKIGRTRSDSLSAEEYEAGAMRPRERYFAANSRLRFQKVLDYSWGLDGQPVIAWGPWVEYRVEDRELVRLEGAQRIVVSANTSGFRVERTAANTLLVTIVTDRHSSDGKIVATQANHFEVLPKN